MNISYYAAQVSLLRNSTQKRFKGFIFLEGPRYPEQGQGIAGRILEVSKAKYILWTCTSYMPVRLGDVNLLLWY